MFVSTYRGKLPITCIWALLLGEEVFYPDSLTCRFKGDGGQALASQRFRFSGSQLQVSPCIYPANNCFGSMGEVSRLKPKQFVKSKYNEHRHFHLHVSTPAHIFPGGNGGTTHLSDKMAAPSVSSALDRSLLILLIFLLWGLGHPAAGIGGISPLGK